MVTIHLLPSGVCAPWRRYARGLVLGRVSGSLAFLLPWPCLLHGLVPCSLTHSLLCRARPARQIGLLDSFAPWRVELPRSVGFVCRKAACQPTDSPSWYRYEF
jgi:hypothetical protein